MSIQIRPKYFIIAAATAVAVGLGGYVWKEEQRQPLLEIYIFAVRGGQSILIRTPEDKRILINGGSNSEIIRHVTKILPFYSRRIDSIIAVDDSNSNVAGLIDIAERFNVDRAYVPAITLKSLGLASSTDPAYSSFLKVLRSKDVLIVEVVAGDRISFDSKVSAAVLFPAPGDSFEYSKTSAPQIILKISHDTNSLVFLGDATKKIQKFITLSEVGTANLVAVSHSALPEKMSIELMTELEPEYLIYSKTVTASNAIAGQTRFNVKESGMVRIVSDGKSLKVIN
jgi:competence protein ComEC